MKKHVKLSLTAEIALGLTGVFSVVAGTAIGIPFHVKAMSILEDYRKSEGYSKIEEVEKEIASAKLQTGEYSQKDYDKLMKNIGDDFYVHNLIINSDDINYNKPYKTNFGVGVGLQMGLSAIGICNFLAIAISAFNKGKQFNEREK